MRITIVGPTHPYKGGIAQYTTALAHALAGEGHRVRIESWSHQYPRLLYPGRLTVREPELPVFGDTARRLSWRRPDGWYAAGRRLRGEDLVVLVVATPVQMPAYRGILAGIGGRARVLAQCHNVLPHERRAMDVALTRGVLSRVDEVLVHSDEQARVAAGLTGRPVTVAPMAALVPGAGVPVTPVPAEPYRRLLFFGLVRRYKGLDALLHALAAGPPEVALRVAGEFWGGTGATTALVEELGLTGRVDLRPGYVDAAEVPALFDDVDALALPYRSATASLNAFLAFSRGRPVIATRVGTLGDAVRDGVDGVLCEPDDVVSLTGALYRFYADGEPARLAGNVPAPHEAPGWRRYCAAVTAAVPR